jgi:amino acid permease
VVITALVNYTMKLLVVIKEEVNKTHSSAPLSSYEDIARDVAGRGGYWATVAAVMLTQTGIGCSYVIFIASQLNSIPHLDALSIRIWALIIAPLMIALSCKLRCALSGAFFFSPFLGRHS